MKDFISSWEETKWKQTLLNKPTSNIRKAETGLFLNITVDKNKNIKIKCKIKYKNKLKNSENKGWVNLPAIYARTPTLFLGFYWGVYAQYKYPNGYFTLKSGGV